MLWLSHTCSPADHALASTALVLTLGKYTPNKTSWGNTLLSLGWSGCWNNVQSPKQRIRPWVQLHGGSLLDPKTQTWLFHRSHHQAAAFGDGSTLALAVALVFLGGGSLDHNMAPQTLVQGQTR